MQAYTSSAPAYLDQLPCARHAWSDVVDAICTARTTIQAAADNEYVELEMRFRLGAPAGHFQPGVPEEAFAALEERLDSCRDWASITDWHNIQTSFHGSSVPGDTRRLRTESCFPPKRDNLAEVVITSVQKELVQNRDYRTVAMGMSLNGVPAEIRVALNIERTVPPVMLPDDVETSSVHVKERKCYYYAPTGCSSPVWCYMLTRRWTGSTFREARKAKDAFPPVCEVEIECIDPSYLLSKDPGKTAVKLLGKACDLLGIMSADLRDQTGFILEPSGGPMLWARHK